ncbi:MAG: response regulator [Desulfobulbaceae bacterium]|nr:response regulator [Desulfobulbaceae bacterium]
MCKEDPTICVVDNELSICNALRRLITSAGFNVITYGSAQEFWDDVPTREPDLLVLDVQMPAMTGLDLQKLLTASGRAIPIVFISARENAMAKSAAMAAGAVAFFQKPIDEEDLLGVIHKWISPFQD